MRADIETIGWHPPAGYDLALEVIPIRELRRRGSAGHFRAPQRVGFFMMLAVTGGRTAHVIDFAALSAGPGTWLLLRPGQTQKFDFEAPWEGFSIVFRPELLPPGDGPLASVPRALSSRIGDFHGRVDLAPREHALCCESVRQMQRDARLEAPAGVRNALMLYQLYVLLLRLELAHGRALGAEPAASVDRVASLGKLVDRHFRERRDVGWYASALHTSVKTLTRATLAVAGVPAKTLIAERVALEAKRLLVHTGLPVAAIAESLGFPEASNFVKFFRREAGCTPSSFRTSSAAGRDAVARERRSAAPPSRNPPRR